MATTTPNFGWDIPQSTDLVKDGATAIAALGNDIDTSMVDLKGGTTGQVLSKASNSDMDFTWVTSDDANAIQNTIVDAKGDIITATAADTPARLAVGSNGYTLVADSSAATGLAYAGTTQGNPVINGGFDIWQRGTSIAGTTTAYTADRWNLYRAVAGSTCSRQATGDTTNLPSIQYCARIQRDSGNTSTTVIYFGTSIESSNSIPYAGKTITLSFYARAGANYSAASSVMTTNIGTGTNTDVNYVTGSASGWTSTSQNNTLTTTWQRFTQSITVPSTAVQLGIQFQYTPAGTAGAADYFEVTGVQIDLGSTALPFRRSGGSIQGELAACQRYYERVTSDTSYGLFGTAITNNSTTATAFLPFKVTKRITPTALDTSTVGNWQLDDGVNGFVATAIVLAGAYKNTQWGAVTVTSSGMTQYRPCVMASAGSTTAYIGFSSEL